MLCVRLNSVNSLLTQSVTEALEGKSIIIIILQNQISLYNIFVVTVQSIIIIILIMIFV